MSSVLQIGALLISGALLHVAGGLQALLMPIRAQNDGFAVEFISFMGSAYAIGFMAGCIAAPRLIKRVGHARAYTAIAAVAAFTVGWLGLWVEEWAWVALRSMTGFAFACAATIAESWLNSKAEKSNRGTLFGWYTMANLGGLTLGQLVLSLFDPTQTDPFVLAGMLFALALIPTALTSSAQPVLSDQPRMKTWPLFKLAPVASFAVFIIGLGSSTFGTLAPVYAQEIGLDVAQTALFMTFALLSGALLQVPIGRLSDRRDRRKVLGGISTASAAVGAAFVLLAGTDVLIQYLLAAALGATIYSLYGVSIALATEQVGVERSLEVAGTMLLLFGVGSVLGPVASLPFKGWLGPSGVFGFICAIHLVLALVIALRVVFAKVTPLPHTEAQAQRPGSVNILLDPEIERELEAYDD